MLNTQYKKAIDSLQANPAAIAALSLRALEESSNGQVKIIDPSNPFVYLMETATMLYCNGLDRNLATLTKLYPENTRTWDHLYRHMSDEDYIGRFSSPGEAPIMFWLSIDEIIQKAVPMNDNSGNYKLTISRNSMITAAGVPVTLLYPIDIIVSQAGSITVKYDVSLPNPLQKISTPDIPFELRKHERTMYLHFSIPILQLEISSSTSTVTGTTGLKRKIKYKDKFYHLRAFMRNDNEDWQEIGVKHNPMVINVNSVTVCVRVLDDTVEVEIPQVYKNTNLLKDNVRIDIYTTRGEINIPILNTENTYFKANWVDNEARNKETYAAPMSVFEDIIIASDGYIKGGTNGATFEQTRRKVVNRSNITEGLPITLNQLDTRLENDGLSSLLALDNVTDRVVLASKNLETLDGIANSAIGALTLTHSTHLDDLVLNNLATRDNGNQVTVLPNMVYELINGKLRALTQERMEFIKSLLNEKKLDDFINMVNSSRFYYSPYFMIHDTTNNIYSVRPYRLDKPQIVNKSIENENMLLGLTSSIIGYRIQVDSNYSGYSIYVQINPSKELRAETRPGDKISLQLRISDENERSYYWFAGQLVTPLDADGVPEDENYSYRFSLPTNWQITENDEILIGDYKIPFKLDGIADIFTVVYKEGLSQDLRTQMDDMIDPAKLHLWTVMNSGNFYTMIQERVRVVFGKRLKHLWTRARTAPEETKYQVYLDDVMATYEEDEFEIDQFGEPRFRWVNGELEYEYKHRQGDPVINPLTQEQEIKHHKGTVVLDAEGKPVPVGGERGLVRQYDIFLLDGKYYYATHGKTVEYRENIKNEIDEWFDKVAAYDTELLERTNVYFHPKTTEGDIRLLVDRNIEVYLPAAQKLNIVYTVDERISKNRSVIASIRKTTVEKLVKFFDNNSTISKSDIIAMLKTEMGEWVIGVKIEGWLNDVYETATILDNSISIAIPKRLAVTSNLEILVEDDIGIEFLTHSIATK